MGDDVIRRSPSGVANTEVFAMEQANGGQEGLCVVVLKPGN